MALDQAAINLIQSMLTKTINQHTTDLKTEFAEQVNNINKNNTENTEQNKAIYCRTNTKDSTKHREHNKCKQ